MLAEGEFKRILTVYRTLRQEGVVFPLRDASHAFLIEFDGAKSPIFETIEGGLIYEEPSKALHRRAYKVPHAGFGEDVRVETHTRRGDTPPMHRHKREQREQRARPKALSTDELDSMVELMAGVLAEPRAFILEDGALSRRTVEDCAGQSARAGDGTRGAC